MFTRRRHAAEVCVKREEYDLLLKEQVAYYRARAGEYDEWFLRQGR